MTAAVREIKRGVDQELVATLEKAVEAARNGETVGILLIEKKVGGASCWSCYGIKDRFEVTGYLFHLAHKMQTDETR